MSMSDHLRQAVAAGLVLLIWSPSCLRADGPPPTVVRDPPSTAGHSPLDRPEATRWRLTLRSGTVLTVAVAKGGITWRPIEQRPPQQQAVDWNRITSIQWATPVAMTTYRQIPAHLARLDDPDFDQRESAMADLTELADTARPLLADLGRSSTSWETRWRLAKLLSDKESAKGDSPAMSIMSDRLIVGPTDSAEEPSSNRPSLMGECLDETITVTWRGHDLTFGRDELDQITRLEAGPSGYDPTQWDWGEVRDPRISDKQPVSEDSERPAGPSTDGDESVAPGLRRIAKLEHDTEKPSRTWFGFELPVGWRDRPHDLREAYADRGLILSGAEDATIGSQGYHVSGPSGPPSIAVAQPRFAGPVFFTFCQPGQVSSAASIRRFACVVKQIKPGGTRLVAFDVWGHQLAEIATRENRVETFGLEGSVPLGRIEIWPVPGVDPDVAIDDVVIDDLQPAPWPALPSAWRVVLGPDDIIVAERWATSPVTDLLPNPTSAKRSSDPASPPAIWVSLGTSEKIPIPVDTIRSLQPPQKGVKAEELSSGVASREPPHHDSAPLPPTDSTNPADGTYRVVLRDRQIIPVGPQESGGSSMAWSPAGITLGPPDDVRFIQWADIAAVVRWPSISPPESLADPSDLAP